MPAQTFCQQLNLRYPIIKAPMAGGCDTPELVAAVSAAGGLGMMGAAYMQPDAIAAAARNIAALTSAPFGINLFIPEHAPAKPANLDAAINAITPLYHALQLPAPSADALSSFDFDAQLEATLESGAQVFSFTFGLMPPSVIQAARQRGMLIVANATNLSEVQALDTLKPDAIVLQGSEAGGHRGTFAATANAPASGMIGLNTLLQCAKQHTQTPLIAAGGIMNGQTAKALLQQGANAVQLGTAFMTCAEAGIPNAYKQALMAGKAENTRLTRAFSGRFARGLANTAMDTLEQTPTALLPFPWQNELTRGLRAAAAKADNADYLSLWAGQGVDLCRALPATELMAALTQELANA